MADPVPTTSGADPSPSPQPSASLLSGLIRTARPKQWMKNVLVVAAPAAAGVLSGRRMATVAKCRLDIEFAGGTYVNEGVVRCGNMVSGRTWHDQHLYMPEFMRMLAPEVATTQRQRETVGV